LIVIDTHIWIWWVHGHSDLKPWMQACLQEHEDDTICVSAISCWEIARLASLSKLDLGCPVSEWFSLALSYPGIELTDLTPEISTEANYLPEPFH
jgi:PIN domain nuclease of toxin-antitoxin system